MLCACVRDRERRYEERRNAGASVRERERRERVACEKGSGRKSKGGAKAAEMTWIMDESSTLMHVQTK